MALCRIKTVEQLRGKAPAELGKLIGLDRVPEVRCLRSKLDALSQDHAAETWMATLLRQWMQQQPQSEADIRPDAAAGCLYVDVHRGSSPAVDRDLSRLFSQLNDMKFTFPGTKLVLHYRLLGETVASSAAAPPQGQNSVNPASQR